MLDSDLGKESSKQLDRYTYGGPLGMRRRTGTGCVRTRIGEREREVSRSRRIGEREREVSRSRRQD